MFWQKLFNNREQFRAGEQIEKCICGGLLAVLLNTGLLQLGKLEISIHKGWSLCEVDLFGDKEIITRPAIFYYIHQYVTLKAVPFPLKIISRRLPYRGIQS